MADMDPEGLAHVDTQALWVTLFVTDTLIAEGTSPEHARLERLVGVLSDELNHRYSSSDREPATELTADWCTGNKLDGDDAVRWALHNFAHLERVARGEVRRGG